MQKKLKKYGSTVEVGLQDKAAGWVNKEAEKTFAVPMHAHTATDAGSGCFQTSMNVPCMPPASMHHSPRSPLVYHIYAAACSHQAPPRSLSLITSQSICPRVHAGWEVKGEGSVVSSMSIPLIPSYSQCPRVHAGWESRAMAQWSAPQTCQYTGSLG